MVQDTNFQSSHNPTQGHDGATTVLDTSQDSNSNQGPRLSEISLSNNPSCPFSSTQAWVQRSETPYDGIQSVSGSFLAQGRTPPPEQRALSTTARQGSAASEAGEEYENAGKKSRDEEKKKQ